MLVRICPESRGITELLDGIREYSVCPEYPEAFGAKFIDCKGSAGKQADLSEGDRRRLESERNASGNRWKSKSDPHIFR